MIGTTKRVGLTLALLGACGALAACGSSSSSSSGSTSASASTTSPSARRSALLTCLKQHGVTLPSRPAGAPPGGGPPGAGGAPGGRFFGGGGGAGGRFANPKFRAAFQACGGTTRFRNGARFRLSRTRITSYVSCVRKSGFPQMPSPDFSGKGPVFPASVRTNPKFQSASRKCQSILVPPRSGSGTSTT